MIVGTGVGAGGSSKAEIRTARRRPVPRSRRTAAVVRRSSRIRGRRALVRAPGAVVEPVGARTVTVVDVIALVVSSLGTGVRRRAAGGFRKRDGAGNAVEARQEQGTGSARNDKVR